jgi:hypothetical protein
MRLPSKTRSLVGVTALQALLTASAAFAGWVPNGNRLRPDAFFDYGEQIPLSIISDGSGSAYIASGSLPWNARLTRLQADGSTAPGWTEDGRYFSAGMWWPAHPRVVGDGRGGAFVVSTDVGCLGAHCTGNFGWIRVHHLGPLGETAVGWSAEGVDFGSWGEAFGNREFTTISNDRGSVLVAWGRRAVQDRSSQPRDLRLQRVDFDGATPWGFGGIQLRDFSWQPFFQTMISDGFGGAYLFWLDERAPGLYGQHVSADGEILWTSGGIPIPDRPFTELGPPVAVPDGAHGAIVAWTGRSNGEVTIFAARVTPHGSLPWRGRGEVFRSARQADGLRLVSTAAGGAILAWRHRLEGNDHIVAQRVDPAGRRQWSPDGVSVCAATGTRDQLAMASDLRSGAYLAWADSRPAFALYGTHLDGNGESTTGWSHDGEPIAARFARQIYPGGMSEVMGVEMTALEIDRPGMRRADLVHGKPAPFTDMRRPPVGQWPASAMLAWVDDRTPFHSFSIPEAFTMLLEPGGPAARAIAQASGPVLVEEDARSEGTLGAAPRRLAMTSTRRGVLHLSFAEDTPATLDLFDVTGRKVVSREITPSRAAVLEVRVSEVATLPPGIYLARVTQGSSTAQARVAILH